MARSPEPSAASRTAILAFGSLVYVLFLVTFTALIAFVEGIGLPQTADRGVRADGLVELLVVDLGLVLLFAVQHTIMARRRFKDWWTRWVPRAIERSIFVLTTCGVVTLMVTSWRTIPENVWEMGDSWGATCVRAVGWAGWSFALVSTFFVDHFRLFGLRQAIDGFRGVPEPAPRFSLRGAYRFLRHPLYLGLLVGFWVTPEMSVGRFVFAGGMSLYLTVGIRFEERSLRSELGDDYAEYQRRVPMLLPVPFGRGSRIETDLGPSTRPGTGAADGGVARIR